MYAKYFKVQSYQKGKSGEESHSITYLNKVASHLPVCMSPASDLSKEFFFFPFQFWKVAKSFIICIYNVVVILPLHIQHVGFEDHKNNSSQTKSLGFYLSIDW